GTYWRMSRTNFDRLDTERRIWWGADGNNMPRLKRFLSEVKDGKVPQTLWKYEDVGHTQEAKKELLERVTFASSDSVFDTPKPTRLIEQALRIGTTTDTEDIVLDFFAGSGTTGEAVWKLNKTDGGNRRFILVQLPEVTGQPDYPTIADITRTRLKSASQALKKATEGTLPFGGSVTPDFGFRVLHQGPSNVRRFVPYTGTDTSGLLPLLRKDSGLMSHAKSENVLIEILLLEGYPLDSVHDQHPDFLSNVVTQITHPHIPVTLLVCLDDQIEEETADILARKEFEKVIFICLETSLSDTVKVRLSDVVHQVKTL
ncbi:MAG: DNA methyltransferase, partial [Myxococcota bacterium]